MTSFSFLGELSLYISTRIKHVNGISFNTKQLSAGIVLHWLLYSCHVCSITIVTFERIRLYSVEFALKNKAWFTVHGLSKKVFKVTAPEIQQRVCHLKSDLAFTLQTLLTSRQPVDVCVWVCVFSTCESPSERCTIACGCVLPFRCYQTESPICFH